jgi:hypothetical protein
VSACIRESHEAARKKWKKKGVLRTSPLTGFSEVRELALGFLLCGVEVLKHRRKQGLVDREHPHLAAHVLDAATKNREIRRSRDIVFAVLR